MAQFQELAHILLSAGCALDPDEKGTYFLYTGNGTLTSKLLTGDKWGDQELLAKNVRQSSAAAFLFNASTSLIAYITSSSSLGVLRYDGDDEEWYEDDAVPSRQLHSEGNLAAEFIPGSNENFYVFLQDTSNNLVRFDDEWEAIILPADPVIGTPLCASVIDDQMHLFYVSNKDRCIHYLVEDGDSWGDNILASCVLDEALTSFTVARNGVGILEAYVLTGDSVILQVVGDGKGETKELGKVDKDGKFIANTDLQAAQFVWKPLLLKLKGTIKKPKQRLDWS